MEVFIVFSIETHGYNTKAVRGVYQTRKQADQSIEFFRRRDTELDPFWSYQYVVEQWEAQE